MTRASIQASRVCGGSRLPCVWLGVFVFGIPVVRMHVGIVIVHLRCIDSRSAQLVGQLNAGWSSRKVSFTLLTAR